MAKKTLNESVVRRFQKLAAVKPINEMYSKNEEYMKEEEEMDMGDEAPMEDMDDMPEEGGDDMEDMGDMDADMGDGTIEVGQEEIAAAKQGLQDALALLDQIMPGDDMDDMDGEEMDFKAEEEEAPDAEDMGEEDIMEALRGINYEPSKGEIVNEVAKRVARRLKEAKLHEAKLNRALGRK